MEKFFWLGFLDGDGCVPRNGRKIALESASKDLICSFRLFLKTNNIPSKYYERKIEDRTYYGARISSAFFKKYSNLLGFLHPRKKKWLTEKLKADFYVSTKSNIKRFLTENNYLDYVKIFDSRKVYLVNSKELIEQQGIKCDHRNNRTLKEVLDALKPREFKKEEILEVLSKFRWKMGKGTNTAVRLPKKINYKLKIAIKFVRIRAGGIGLSKRYIVAFNESPDKIRQLCEELFDINPKRTCKNEPIFCSSVLNLLFSKIISRSKEKYIPPKFHEAILC